jgi:hypothetical protein
VNWWRNFVRQVLGFESALPEEDLGEPQILPTEQGLDPEPRRLIE